MVRVRDAWARRDAGRCERRLAARVAAHGARLFVLTPESERVVVS